ncbi:Endo-1,3 like [Actinidia chinensis var. chinensis]|uniref:Endo-1,3 like n=1 Tax=Actinidia chinensis var. chinensis TaxID=1590841 RepID=A0A2R6PP05_ACTCC|nr:Endo-1,3 like [Actinidia chinensis var. chinensis]
MSGSQCCENPPTLTTSCGLGSVLQIGGLKSYVTGPPHSNLAILLISDVFGYEAPNLRKLADKVASAGFYVVVPDFFNGDYFDPANAEWPLELWVQSHGTDKGFEEAKQVVAALESNGVSAIGAAGFCWGAKVVVELSKFDYIQAAVLLHPALVKIDDFKEVKVPIAVLGAELDQISPPALLKQFNVVLSSKPEVKSYVKIFPGVKHGWSIRYRVDRQMEAKSAEEAHQEMLNWFTELVKPRKRIRAKF